MLIIEKKVLKVFKTTVIWFGESPEYNKASSSIIYRQCNNKYDVPNFKRSEFSTLIIDLEKEVDELWRGITSKNCRYKIKRAEREGVTVKVSYDFEGFYERYNDFANKKGIEPSELSAAEMERYGILLVAKYNDKIISSQLYLRDKEYIRLFLACSDRFNNNSKMAGYANRMLFWEAIQYAKKNGIKIFDFGGYYTGDKPDAEKEQINSSKKEFGGKLVIQYNYTRVDSIVYKLLKVGYKMVSSLRKAGA